MRALITGITGQDGSYMAELLLSKGYEVHGLVRRSSTFNTERIDHIRDKITTHYGDLTDPFSLMWIMKKVMPDEIYNFAAQSHVAVSWETPFYTMQATAGGVLNVLEAARFVCPNAKIYQASTSELFSGLENHRQNEETIKDPVSPYGTAKLYGYQIARNYRKAFGMFICNGILFNHESYRRGDNFVTKKICLNAPSGEVKLGNTDASRDWGWAPEYVEAAWRMLQQPTPDDYVIATGETHTVKEFVDWVSESLGHEVKVIHDTSYDRPTDVPVLCGDASKAERVLGWKPTVTGKKLVEKMLEKDYDTRNS